MDVELEMVELEALGAAVAALNEAGDRLHAACLERLVARAVRARQEARSAPPPWCFVATAEGLAPRAAAPDGADVVPLAVWRCAGCGWPVLRPAERCGNCVARHERAATRASAPAGATVLPIATWPCPSCRTEPVTVEGRLCAACRAAEVDRQNRWEPDGPRDPAGDSWERWHGGGDR